MINKVENKKQTAVRILLVSNDGFVQIKKRNNSIKENKRNWMYIFIISQYHYQTLHIWINLKWRIKY